MSMTDSIADMLTRIRNAQQAKLLTVLLPHSKLKCSVLDVLKTEGYIKDYSVSYEDSIGHIEIELKYSAKGLGAIYEIQKVSKPSKRVYSSIRDLKGCYNNMGIYIISTSRGVVSDREATRLGIGGEIICKVF